VYEEMLEKSYPEPTSQTKVRSEEKAKPHNSTAANERELRERGHNMGEERDEGCSHTKKP
jgi:hypothetical protein